MYTRLTLLVVTLLLAGMAHSAPTGETAKTKAEAAAAEKKDAATAKKEAAAPAEKKETAATAKTAAASKATPTPTAGGSTAGTDKPGFFSRVFRGKKTDKPSSAATPTPAPATATPRPRRPRKAVETSPDTAGAANSNSNEEKAEGGSESTPPKPTAKSGGGGDEAASAPEGEVKPVVAESAPVKKGAKGKGSTVAANPPAPEKNLTKEQQAVAQAEAAGDAEALEKAKYDEVKSRAVTDGKVQELKAKADNAATDEEGKKELKAYNRALFQKMRSLDPSIKGRVDRVEAAVLKQLD